MPGRIREIRYRTVPDWFIPVFFRLYWTAGLSTMIVLGLLVLFGPTHRSCMELLWVFLTLTLLGGVLSSIGAQSRLALSSRGIVMPVNMMPDLHFRPSRGWDDIASVGLEEPPGGLAFSRIKSDLVRRTLRLQFASGGKARIELRRLNERDMRILVGSIAQWCKGGLNPEFLDLHEALLHSDESRAATTHEEESTATFTQIWEDELCERFAATTFVPLDAGDKLQEGRYIIDRQLAAGGMSAIYKATSWQNQTVVLKEANLPATTSEATRCKARELFQRESQFLRQLDHPQIAKIYDHFVERGRDYLVLEFVAGYNLRQLVKQNGALDESRALNYARQIACILQYLHEQSPPILHRDLTPENLVLDDSGNIVLIDFGAANEFVANATGTLIGKQAYIAPEQFRGKATPASDIYALGCTLHFLLTGEEPEALSQSHPKLLQAELSDALDDLVAGCTSLEPCARISAAVELIGKIDDCTERGLSPLVRAGTRIHVEEFRKRELA